MDQSTSKDIKSTLGMDTSGGVVFSSDISVHTLYIYMYVQNMSRGNNIDFSWH